MNDAAPRHAPPETSPWPLTDEQGWAFELAPATAHALLDVIAVMSRWPEDGDGFGADESH
jgi:hypothetical protein